MKRKGVIGECKGMAHKVKHFPVTAFEHLQGNKHTMHHRMWVGIGFMVFGVFIAMFVGEYSEHHAVKFVCDGFGYLLHGAGATPFIEHLTKIVNKMNEG